MITSNTLCMLGMQAGLDSLKCLAFAADSLGPDDAFSATEHR